MACFSTLEKLSTMKKASLLTTLFILGSFGLFAQTKWNVDKAHSNLDFTVTHMSLSEVDGRFKNFDASITASKPDFSDAVFTLSADVASINTENDMRDGDLKSDKYFDIAKYPKMTFVSKSISRINAKKYKLTGDLTLHGVTKTVSLELTYNGTGKSMRTQKPVAGFKVTGTINRNDFGVGHAPGAIISEDIDIKANGEFEQAI